jgi:hypothetical protein
VFWRREKNGFHQVKIPVEPPPAAEPEIEEELEIDWINPEDQLFPALIPVRPVLSGRSRLDPRR